VELNRIKVMNYKVAFFIPLMLVSGCNAQTRPTSRPSVVVTEKSTIQRISDGVSSLQEENQLLREHNASLSSALDQNQNLINSLIRQVEELKKAAASRPAYSVYVVKVGDTLFSIAKNQLGDGNKWKSILEANPGATQESLMVPGRRVFLP
jgi:LysM repeat protein